MEWWQWAISTGAVVSAMVLVYGALHRELRGLRDVVKKDIAALDQRVRALEEGLAFIRGLLESRHEQAS